MNPLDLSVHNLGRSQGTLSTLPQTAEVMEHLDPVHISAVLRRNRWNVEIYISHLIGIIDGSDQDKRLKLAAMNQLDKVIERAAELTIKRLLAENTKEPSPLVNPPHIDQGLVGLTNFMENTKDARTTVSVEHAGHAASLHLAPEPRPGYEEEESH